MRILTSNESGRASGYLPKCSGILGSRCLVSTLTALCLLGVACGPGERPAVGPGTSQDAEAEETDPLRAAILARDYASLRTLVRDGALEDAGSDGNTALLLAIERNFGAGIRLLLGAGAQTEARDREGQTAVHVAVARNSRGVVDWLAAAGADLHAPIVSGDTRNGWTPLMVAAASGRDLIAQTLLEADASVSAVSARGRTALHVAAWHGHVAVIELLLAAGADSAAVDATGLTPVDLVRMDGSEEAVRLITGESIEDEATDDEATDDATDNEGAGS